MCKLPGQCCLSGHQVSQEQGFEQGMDVFSCMLFLQGCWTLAGGHGREVFEHIHDKLDAHVEAGFTTFDTGKCTSATQQSTLADSGPLYLTRHSAFANMH